MQSNNIQNQQTAIKPIETTDKKFEALNLGHLQEKISDNIQKIKSGLSLQLKQLIKESGNKEENPLENKMQSIHDQSVAKPENSQPEQKSTADRETVKLQELLEQTRNERDSLRKELHKLKDEIGTMKDELTNMSSNYTTAMERLSHLESMLQ